MKSEVPFLAMMAVQFAQVVLMVVSKKAMATGITNFTFIFYSNAIDSLILLPFSSTDQTVPHSLFLSFLDLSCSAYLVIWYRYLGMQGYSMPLQHLPPQCSTSSQVLPSYLPSFSGWKK